MHYLGLRVRDLELLEACRRRDRDLDPAIRRTVLVWEGGRDRDRDVAADGSRLAADGGGTLRRWTDGDEDDELRDRLKKSKYSLLPLYFKKYYTLNQSFGSVMVLIRIRGENPCRLGSWSQKVALLHFCFRYRGLTLTDT